jgi:type IV secretory pathway VirB4 component
MDDSLSSQLSYFNFVDEFLTHLDGSISASFKVGGIDPSSLSEGELEATKKSIESMFNVIEEGVEIQVFFRCKDRYDKGLGLYDRYVDTMEQKKPFAVALYGSSLGQLKQENLFCSDIFIFLTVHKFKIKKNNVFEAIDRNKGVLETISKTVFSYLQNTFEKACKLSKQETVELLYESLNADRWEISQTFNESGSLPIGVEDTLSNRLTFNGIFYERDHFYSDKTFGQTVTLYAKPNTSHPAMFFRLLAQLEETFHFHCSYKVVGKDQYKEIQSKNRYRGVLESFSDFSLFGSRRNFKMEAKFEDNEDYLEEMERNGEKSFQFHFTITHYSKSLSRLRDQSGQIIKAFRALNGADAFIQEYEQQRGHLASLPASRFETNRPYEELTKNISNMAPLYEPYSGGDNPVILFRNRFNGLISYNPFSPELPNYNGIVSGTSGSGKSFFVSHLCRNYIAQDARVLFIDIGGSYSRTIECFGGIYYSLDSNISLNPLLPSSIVVKENETSPWGIQTMIEILTTMMKDNNRTGNTHEENLLLSNCLVDLYKNVKDPILSDLVVVMEASSDNLSQASPYESELLLNLLKKMKYWVNGPYKSIFNQQSTLSLESRLIGFDLKGVPEEIRGHIFLILSSWIDFIVFQEKGKKIVVFDEAWELIEDASALIEGLYRKSRKNNASIISVAQSYSDFLECPISKAIIGSSSCKYILKVGENPQPIADSLDLSEADVDNILSLQKISGHFSEVFIKHGEKKFVARIVPTPIEYWTSTTDPKDLTIQNDFETKFPHFTRMTTIIELASQYPYGFATENGGQDEKLKIA